MKKTDSILFTSCLIPTVRNTQVPLSAQSRRNPSRKVGGTTEEEEAEWNKLMV